MFQHRSSGDSQAGERGFTLVELLVVIVILGILAGVVVFAVSGISDRGTDSACETDRRAILTAVEAYRAQADNEPNDKPTMDELVDADLLNAASDYHDLEAANYDGNKPKPVGKGKCVSAP